MKSHLFIVFIVFFGTEAFCQTTLHYTYDAAGNRIERSIYLGGSKSGIMDESIIRQEEIIKDDTFLPSTILIYPNPTDGLLQIEIIESGDGDSDFALLLTDSNGMQILRKKEEASRTIIDLSDQPAGLYILNITLNNGIKMERS